MVEQKELIIRTATHAGSGYNSSKKKLDGDLTGYLNQAEKTIPEPQKLRALIGPHAGFAYSGPTAAWAYKNVDAKNYDRVVLLGPSHKVYFDFCGTSTCDEWETPLGNVQVDTKTVDNLCQQGDGKLIKRINLKAELNEHSLEMHLPYIQKIFQDAEKEFTLIPIMVGSLPKEKLAEHAKALLPLFRDQKTLFIVSSDFCHWGEPFDYMPLDKSENTIYKGIEKLDKAGMTLIEN
jgi:AmmeMemoRadiSam system protein B